jgi:hypothetical protein
MQDYFSFIFDGMNKILSQHSAFFESTGMELFRYFAVIVISWFGIQSILSGADGGGGFHWGRFFSLLQRLLLVYAMLAFYSVPMPLVGVSLTHLVLDQVTALTAQLNQARIQEIIETLNGVESNLPYPSPYEILAIFRFMVLLGCVLAAQAVTLYVVMFGYVATAVLILLGPLFIPFKIVPEMDWLFWGWFRAFIQFAFYQVVASAYVFIFGDFLLQFFGAKTVPMSSADVAYLFVPILVTFILGTIKVPALTFSLFSGRSGDYVFLRWR